MARMPLDGCICWAKSVFGHAPGESLGEDVSRPCCIEVYCRRRKKSQPATCTCWYFVSDDLWDDMIATFGRPDTR